jgi:hypothetical protein
MSLFLISTQIGDDRLPIPYLRGSDQSSPRPGSHLTGLFWTPPPPTPEPAHSMAAQPRRYHRWDWAQTFLEAGRADYLFSGALVSESGAKNLANAEAAWKLRSLS